MGYGYTSEQRCGVSALSGQVTVTRVNTEKCLDRSHRNQQLTSLIPPQKTPPTDNLDNARLPLPLLRQRGPPYVRR